MKVIKWGKTTGIAIILSALFVTTACNKTEEVVQEVIATPVAVAEAYAGTLSGSNQLTGIAKAGSDIAVLPKSSGQIVELLVSQGDTVEAGQPLARLESKDQQLALDAERAGLSQAENGLKRARNGLATAKQTRDVALKEFQLELDNAKRQLETASINLERMKVLFEEGLISQQQLEEVENGYKAAEAGLERLKLQVSQAEKGLTVEEVEGQLALGVAKLRNAEAQIRDAEIAVTDAEIAVEARKISVQLAEKRVNETKIVAPVAGQISQLNHVVGEMVSPQTNFARLISDDIIIVELSISAQQLMMVEIGDKVEVQFSSHTEKIEGIVTSVALAADQSGLFKVEVEVDNKQKLFRSGMVATVSIQEVLVADSIIVPTSAIVERQGIAHVFIVNENNAVEKEIEVIRYDTDHSAIIGDVNDGDKVVIKGQNLLSDGDLIRIVEEEK